MANRNSKNADPQEARRATARKLEKRIRDGLDVEWIAGVGYCGPDWEEATRRRAELLPCSHAESIATADGHGAYCRFCGETLA